MQVPLYNHQGDQISQIELRDDIFGIKPNTSVMHQAYLRQLANARQGNADSKTRGEVRGGGKKPWKQKGTGRARQGTTRAPHWKGGGVVFGPHPRSYEQKMPRKMRHLALKSALAAKAQENQIKVVEDLSVDGYKTKDVKAILDRLDAKPSVLILLPEANAAFSKSANNLADVKTLRTGYLNVRDLLSYEIVLMSKAALTAVETFFDSAVESKRGESAANGGK
jgi:large subunit ribosomal protein L4